MPRPPVMPPEEKTRLVLSILAGEMSIAEAARRAKVSEESVSNWKRRLRGRPAGCCRGWQARPNARERQLLTELEEVKAALGEAHVELRVWKKSGAVSPPSRISRWPCTQAGMPITRFSQLIGMPFTYLTPAGGRGGWRATRPAGPGRHRWWM